MGEPTPYSRMAAAFKNGTGGMAAPFRAPDAAPGLGREPLVDFPLWGMRKALADHVERCEGCQHQDRDMAETTVHERSFEALSRLDQARHLQEHNSWWPPARAEYDDRWRQAYRSLHRKAHGELVPDA